MKLLIVTVSCLIIWIIQASSDATNTTINISKYSHLVKMENTLQNPTSFEFDVIQTILNGQSIGLNLDWKGKPKSSNKNQRKNKFDCVVNLNLNGQIDDKTLKCQSNKASIWTWAKWHIQMSDYELDVPHDNDFKEQKTTMEDDLTEFDQKSNGNGHRNRKKERIIRDSRNGEPNVDMTVEHTFNNDGIVQITKMSYDSTGKTSIEQNTSNYTNIGNSTDECGQFKDVASCTLNIGKCIWYHDYSLGCKSVDTMLVLHKDEKANIQIEFTEDGKAIKKSQYDLTTFHGNVNAIMKLTEHKKNRGKDKSNRDYIDEDDDEISLFNAFSDFVRDQNIEEDEEDDLFGPNTYKRFEKNQWKMRKILQNR